MSERYDPSTEGARMSFDGRMSYGDYLALDQVLTAQHPLSDLHDELLFIIQHQTSELWMKLALHELNAARAAIAADQMRPAFKMLTRVARIFEQLNNAWDVLRTMTPSEYQGFRPSLGESSGFQSWQYRLIEYAVGNRNHALLRPHDHRPDLVALLQAELDRPSLYDQVQACAARQGLPIPPISCAATCASHGPKMPGSRPHGRRFTATRRRIGRCMSWPKSWSISRIISAAGDSIT